MTNLSTVVDFYRASSKPQFDGRSFSATVEINNNSLRLVNLLINSHKAYGYFEDIDINDEFIDEDDLKLHPIKIGDKFSYTYIPPKNGAERFYNSILEFLSINSLKKGVIPKEYYIIDEDFHPSDSNKPDEIIKIEKICAIISSLAEIAHFHDTKSESSNYRLVFVRDADAKSTSVILETCITPEMLNINYIDEAIIKSLLDIKNSQIPHQAEKTGIFRNTIVEFILDNKYDFESLICHWDTFVRLFENNLSTYMSGFSFHKARKEIAQSEAEFAEKISKLITDLTTKVLSIPVSLLASFGILKLTSKPEMLLVLLGVLLSSLILHMVLLNQEKQLKHICHAKDIAFMPFINNNENYPDELKKDINKALDELSKSQTKCDGTIKLFMCLAWLPSSIAAGIFFAKFFT
ncbi:hypothetical protein DPU22_15490 [Salmonella enterica subsp. enterica serovar Newport]|uniref:Uncharacterized protein n=1 Tax=Salmonella enterica I TaxID=59201 RepID=A0A3V2NXL7_SALET|nr:hypothetical protein [Salmonella enterica subsp. enterica serovar Newport]EBZ2215225.1 hypothetical protein [Salmonella enterica subsp. enterica serovar Montevideo]ECM1026259.1 hypothetical protein [Salmonella enterica subsp. enterica serovar Give]EEC0578875.1 hypothetical protein [Salmonella enterica]EBR9096694.1 hypothetical protein [Salmonella enterica subsp. enterica serovar Newport]